VSGVYVNIPFCVAKCHYCDFNSRPPQDDDEFGSYVDALCRDIRRQPSRRIETVFFGGGKMRGDFTTTVNGKVEVSHMINDGTTVYTWVDGQAMAMKMAVSAMDNMQSKAPASGQPQPAVDPNAKHDYNCSSWTLDQATFSLPKGVDFKDFSAMMNAGASASGGAPVTPPSGSANNAAACAACNNAGAGKAQCLAALHC